MIFLAEYMPYELADENQPFHFIDGRLVPIIGDFQGGSVQETNWIIYLGV